MKQAALVTVQNCSFCIAVCPKFEKVLLSMDVAWPVSEVVNQCDRYMGMLDIRERHSERDWTGI